MARDPVPEDRCLSNEEIDEHIKRISGISDPGNSEDFVRMAGNVSSTQFIIDSGICIICESQAMFRALDKYVEKSISIFHIG